MARSTILIIFSTRVPGPVMNGSSHIRCAMSPAQAGEAKLLPLQMPNPLE